MNRRLAIGFAVLAVLLAILGWETWPRSRSRARVPPKRPAEVTAAAEARDAGDPLHTPMFAPRESVLPSDDEADLLAEIQADDRYNLVCHLSEAVPAPITVQFYDDHNDRGGSGVLIVDQAWLIVPTTDGSATLHPQDLQPMAFRWTGAGEGTRGRCAPDALTVAPLQRATVRGFVANAGDSGAPVTVEGCGGRATVLEDGSFVLEGTSGDCRLQALRRDGVFYARSQPVDVHLDANQDLRVDLTIPARKTAGLGIQIGRADGGIAVLDLIDGGAAAEAGLEEGDVIIGLDGESTADVSLEEFQERALGEAGTRVSLVVRGQDGEERDVTLDRRSID